MSLSFSIDLKKKKISNKNKKKKKRAKSDLFGNDSEGNLLHKNEFPDATNFKKRQKIKLTEISQNDLIEMKPEKDELIIRMINDNIKDDLSVQEMTTPTDYKSVPVEEFGTAMLRGMGWNGKSQIDSKSETENISKNVHAESVGIGASNDVKAVDTDSFMPLVKLNKGHSG